MVLAGTGMGAAVAVDITVCGGAWTRKRREERAKSE